MTNSQPSKIRSKRTTHNGLSLGLELDEETWSPGAKLQGRLHLEMESGRIPVAWCRVRVQCVLVGKIQAQAGPEKMLPSTHQNCQAVVDLSIPETEYSTCTVPFELSVPFGPETSEGELLFIGWSIFADRLIPIGRPVEEVIRTQDFLPNYVGMTIPVVTRRLDRTPALERFITQQSASSESREGAAGLETIVEVDRIFGEGFYGYQQVLREAMAAYSERYRKHRRSGSVLWTLLALGWAYAGVTLLGEFRGFDGGYIGMFIDLVMLIFMGAIFFLPLFPIIKRLARRLLGSFSVTLVEAPDFFVQGYEHEARLRIQRSRILGSINHIEWRLVYSQHNELNVRVRRRRQSHIQRRVEVRQNTIVDGKANLTTGRGASEIVLTIPMPVTGQSSTLSEAPREGMRPSLRTSLVQQWEIVVSIAAGKQIFEERIPISVVPFRVD